MIIKPTLCGPLRLCELCVKYFDVESQLNVDKPHAEVAETQRAAEKYNYSPRTSYIVYKPGFCFATNLAAAKAPRA